MTPPRLSSQDFEKFFPDTDLTTGKVLYVIHRYYCAPMVRSCKCTTNCELCHTNLANIIARRPKETVRNPYALMTWKARDLVADIQEQDQIIAVPRTNWLGERIEVNPFLAVLEEL